MTVDNCASIFGKDSVHTPIPYSLKALLQTLQFHGMHDRVQIVAVRTGA